MGLSPFAKIASALFIVVALVLGKFGVHPTPAATPVFFRVFFFFVTTAHSAGGVAAVKN